MTAPIGFQKWWAKKLPKNLIFKPGTMGAMAAEQLAEDAWHDALEHAEGVLNQRGFREPAAVIRSLMTPLPGED